MHDRTNRLAGPCEIVRQFGRSNEAAQQMLGDVPPFLPVAQPVAKDNLPLSLFGQCGDDVGADEAGAAGDDDQVSHLETEVCTSNACPRLRRLTEESPPKCGRLRF